MLILAWEAANPLVLSACLLVIITMTRFIHQAHRQLEPTIILLSKEEIPNTTAPAHLGTDASKYLKVHD